ncbi:LysR family transcriptional regulator [Gordonia westfalica]|uniref:DNA-binding transcriptional regulator, LysR family n=1 Tax=Gordonia westfalica TaxID=158898 RepID=A0A1H2JIR5_9ACTN|nr:LysR family transcriptional regulator [Gordonia westfalica]SDU56028.1 DNA-binding transcriptional regulator, LysR family [Gordonia westfalica]
MDLHLVTYFVAVVDHGGITRAAQSLYISQPSLSQAIRTLEKRLGVTLFDRTGRRLELTEAGRKLDDAARRILADVERAKRKVDSVRKLQAGRVDVVTYAAFSIDPLVDIVRLFRERFPKLAVRVLAADSPAGVLSALRSGNAEIGVIDSSAEHATFSAIPMSEQELVVAAPEELADGLPDTVPRSAIRSVPLVVDHSDQHTAALFAELIDDDAHNIVIDCPLPAAIWNLVERGTGATVVPRVVADKQLAGARQLALDPPLTRPWGLVLRSGLPSPAALAFISAARAHSGLSPEPIETRDW